SASGLCSRGSPHDKHRDRKIKRLFPPTASAHSMPPCSRWCPHLGSARTPRASGWPALDVGGRPPSHPPAHGQDGWRGTSRRPGLSKRDESCRVCRFQPVPGLIHSTRPQSVASTSTATPTCSPWTAHTRGSVAAKGRPQLCATAALLISACCWTS